MRFVHSTLAIVTLALVCPGKASAEPNVMEAAAQLFEQAPQMRRSAVAKALAGLLAPLEVDQMTEQFPRIDAMKTVATKLLWRELLNRDGKEWVMSEADPEQKVEAVARRPNGSLNKGVLREIEARRWLGDGRSLHAIYTVQQGSKLVLDRLAIAVQGKGNGRSYALVVNRDGARLLAKEKGRAVFFRHDLQGAGRGRTIRIAPLHDQVSNWVHQRQERHAGKL
jgi:hypothetical protein